MTDMEDHKQFVPKIPTPNQPQGDFVSAPNTTRTDKDFIVKDFFSVDNNDTFMGHGQIFNRTAVSTLVGGAVYSLATTDYLVGITSLSYAPTIGLPRPKLVGVGKTFRVKDEVGGAVMTTITVRSQGEELIDGATTSTIILAYGAKAYYTDGANWFTY